MRDYQELVDLLQTATGRPGDWDHRELAELAEEYSEQCRALNKRIGECFKLLREGQTAEVVRLAELEPRLFDWKGALDFPERERWVLQCELMGIPPPPALMEDQFKAVRDACMASATLETLMRWWRYQNLTRATISERLYTLRRLAAAETNTKNRSVWQDRIRAFEEAWLQEIRQEVAAAVKQEDRDHLLRLRGQIESATWTVQVPRKVIEEINRAVASLERSRMTVRLREVVEKLSAAYAAQDEQSVGEALEEFDKLCTALNLDRHDPDRIAAEPAREWWIRRRQEAEQRRRAAGAEAALDRELDNPSTLERIVKLYDAATSGGRTLPIELERRYRIVVARLTQERHQAHQLRLAIAGAIALVLIVIVIVAAWPIMRYRESLEVARRVEEFVTKNELEAAKEFVGRLEKEGSSLLRFRAVQAALARLKAAQDRNNQRQRQFKALEDRINVQLANKDGLPSWNDLQRLGALAESEDEIRRLDSLKQRAYYRCRERLADLEKRISMLEKVPNSQVTLNEIAQLEAGLDELKQSPFPDLETYRENLEVRLDVIKSRSGEFGLHR